MNARTAALRFLILLALVATPLGPVAAEGRIQRGVRAAPFDALATSGADGFSLARARGRFVFLQFFSVRCKHCQRFVPRMNAIHERYATRGMTVAAVTREGLTDIRSFRKKYDARYPVVVAHVDVQVEYGVESYPTAFLIAPNGRVLWRGSPDRMRDTVFDAYLRKFPILPEPVGRFAWVSETVREARLGEVEQKLERHRRCRTIRTDECRFVLGALDWLDAYARSSLEAALRDEEAGRFFDAWWTYGHLATAYPGTSTSQEAKSRRNALVADPARAQEVEGQQALRKARRRARQLPVAAGAAALRTVARVHPDTRAAVTAKALAEAWSRTE